MFVNIERVELFPFLKKGVKTSRMSNTSVSFPFVYIIITLLSFSKLAMFFSKMAMLTNIHIKSVLEVLKSNFTEINCGP